MEEGKSSILRIQDWGKWTDVRGNWSEQKCKLKIKWKVKQFKKEEEIWEL